MGMVWLAGFVSFFKKKYNNEKVEKGDKRGADVFTLFRIRYLDELF